MRHSRYISDPFFTAEFDPVLKKCIVSTDGDDFSNEPWLPGIHDFLKSERCLERVRSVNDQLKYSPWHRIDQAVHDLGFSPIDYGITLVDPTGMERTYALPAQMGSRRIIGEDFYLTQSETLCMLVHRSKDDEGIVTGFNIVAIPDSEMRDALHTFASNHRDLIVPLGPADDLPGALGVMRFDLKQGPLKEPIADMSFCQTLFCVPSEPQSVVAHYSQLIRKTIGWRQRAFQALLEVAREENLLLSSYFHSDGSSLDTSTKAPSLMAQFIPAALADGFRVAVSGQKIRVSSNY